MCVDGQVRGGDNAVACAPLFRPPPGACDCQAHVFSPATRRALVASAGRAPVVQPVDAFLAHLDGLRLSRGVLVTASASGVDNGAVLQALRRHPDRLRGSVVLLPDVGDAELDEWHEAGVRGACVSLYRVAGRSLARHRAGLEMLELLGPRLRARGWHAQIRCQASDLVELAPRLRRLRLPLVIDHMGRPSTSRGVQDGGFQALCALLADGRAWAKLSGAGRMQRAGAGYQDVDPFVAALWSANPDHLVWGSDWPHFHHASPAGVPDDSVLLNLLARWLPAPADRWRVLVGNAAKLYGFEAAPERKALGNHLLAKSNQMAEHPAMDHSDRIEAVRRFNRFYTRHIGALNEGLLDSAFSLTECRVLWELAHAGKAGITATELGRLLDLDAGYLSRLLRGLKDKDLVRATRSAEDARQSLLQLSPAGRRAFQPLDQRSRQQVGELLGRLGESQQGELLQAYQRVQRLLEAPDASGAGAAAGATGAAKGAKAPSFILRPHRPGDMGWLVSRHGALYAREYQLDMRFEALVARIAAEFIDRFDARREACWIAERDGLNIGCVCLVQARDEATQSPIAGTAQLRLLLVEPSARGLGLGERLVEECHRFARDAGYQRVRLWTNSHLHAAKRIYGKAGYQLVASEVFSAFGQENLVGETWELDLARLS